MAGIRQHYSTIYKRHLTIAAIHGEHWLGNDVIHLLTNQDAYTLRIDLVTWDRRRASVEYDYFMVDGESEGYRLHLLGHRGPGPDSLLKHNNRKFSTHDVDNDSAAPGEFGGSCARRFTGAWWYFRCYKSNLNGRYYRGGAVASGRYDGVAWNAWTGNEYSLKTVEMKIRPRRANNKDV